MTQPTTPLIDTKTKQRLEAFLDADTRYSVAPVPAVLDPATAVGVLLPRINPATEVQVIDRASQVTILHDLASMVRPWQLLVPSLDQAPESIARSAAAIAALAWIGDEPVRAGAAKSFADLLQRADPEKSLQEVLNAADALGDAEQLDLVEAWVRRHAERLSAQAATADPGRPDAAHNALVRSELLHQVNRVQVPRFRRNLQTRAQTLALAPMERAARLVELYCETDDASDAPLVWWSACTLARLPFKLDEQGHRVPDAQLRSTIAQNFLDLAKAHDVNDEKLQDEHDLTRQRALHAAVYFQGIPPEADRLWLSQRPDYGIDILVLRPDFQYPAPHRH